MKTNYLEFGTLLTKEEALKTKGGANIPCDSTGICPAGFCCASGYCIPADSGGCGGSGNPGGCGWKGATQTPCLIDWNGPCPASCDAFFNLLCAQSAVFSWCNEP